MRRSGYRGAGRRLPIKKFLGTHATPPVLLAPGFPSQARDADPVAKSPNGSESSRSAFEPGEDGGQLRDDPVLANGT